MLGWDNAFHCEINPFGRKVLEYWFPDSVSYEDITKTDFTQWRGKIDILTGGFPCQPFSYAGKRGGREDERYLWPEMCRAIQEIRPTWVVGENVAGITTMVEGGILTEVGEETPLFEPENIIHGYELEQSFTIERICKDFEAIGYEVQPMLIPAAACGAPHRRDRVFFIAYNAQDPNYDGRGQREYEIEGSQRLFRHPCSGDSPRLRPEAGADAPHSGDARSESERRRQAEIHSPGSAANSDGGRRGQMDEHLQPELADGAEPFSDGGMRNASNAKSGRAGELRNESKTQGARSRNELLGVCGGLPHVEGDTADTFRKRYDWATDRGLIPEERWREFPTVPAVYRGNDGIPFDVDGLTVPPIPAPPTYGKGNPKKYPFSKWRTETLKAYGNAIVPQVMYRIFQAIEQVSR